MLSLLLPAVCAVCARVGQVLCPACAAQLQPAPPGPVDALVAYEGAGRALVTALKYRNRRAVIDLLGRALAAQAPPGVDAVTWAPTTAVHRRERGFDQAELLARAVGRAARLPCPRLLVRPAGPPQTGRSRSQRITGPRFTAAVAEVRGCVLVIDDVVTTGATLRAASVALRAAGAETVVLLAVAATPAPGARRDAVALAVGSLHEPGGDQGVPWRSP